MNFFMFLLYPRSCCLIFFFLYFFSILLRNKLNNLIKEYLQHTSWTLTVENNTRLTFVDSIVPHITKLLQHQTYDIFAHTRKDAETTNKSYIIQQLKRLVSLICSYHTVSTLRNIFPTKMLFEMNLLLL